MSPPRFGSSPRSAPTHRQSVLPFPSSAPSPRGMAVGDEPARRDMMSSSVGVLRHRVPVPSARIAAFDLDNTIIDSPDGYYKKQVVFDWRWNIPLEAVRAKLAALLDSGYRIVLFTNQAGIGKNTALREKFQAKLRDISKKLDLPLLIFFACFRDYCRKPAPGMWEIFVNSYNGSFQFDRIDYNASFYCGDAAGRPEGWHPQRKADFADTDRKFAMNANLNFFTPEEFFFDESPAPFALSGFNPTLPAFHEPKMSDDDFLSFLDVHTDGGSPSLDLINASPESNGRGPELILLVGPPGCGKSKLAEFISQATKANYKRFVVDDVDFPDQYTLAIKGLLQGGSSVIVDSDFRFKTSRAKVIRVAKSLGHPVRCFHFDMPIEFARHLHTLASKTTKSVIQRVSYFTKFETEFQAPDLQNEGFDEVKVVPFHPRFDTDTLRHYLMRLT